jgi:hypothetical protein
MRSDAGIAKMQPTTAQTIPQNEAPLEPAMTVLSHPPTHPCVDILSGARPPARLGAGLWRWLVVWVVALSTLLLLGCAVALVSDHDKEAVERSTDISKAVLKFYQDLVAIEPNKRAAALAGPLGAKQGDIDSQMRLHQMREQARTKNTESIDIATNMLTSWQKFTANHQSNDSTALNNTVLGIERIEMERHLRAAFKAEEAKKLVSATPPK